jgi:putative Holliday junction resolvase
VRVLALDYGSARCGAAISDPTGTIVTPIEPVLQVATKRGMRRLRQVVAEREVSQVVVGLPLSLSGAESEQTREARRFAEALARALGPEVPVVMHDERLTTRQAQRPLPGGERFKAAEDSRAAAHLLESWLSSSR